MRSNVVAVCLVFGITSAVADAAQYVVREGDTVYSVGRLLGHTSYQLAQMNDITVRSSSERLPVGLPLTYVSSADLDAARMQIEVLAEPLSSKDRAPWDELLAACASGMSGVRYQPDAQGLTWRRVLAFARQWRAAHPVLPLNAPPVPIPGVDKDPGPVEE